MDALSRGHSNLLAFDPPLSLGTERSASLGDWWAPSRREDCRTRWSLTPGSYIKDAEAPGLRPYTYSPTPGQHQGAALPVFYSWGKRWKIHEGIGDFPCSNMFVLAHFYGRCGEQLECRLDAGGDLSRGEVPEPLCVCRSQRPLCGSDGRTYAQICRLQEAARARPDANLTVAHPGPCETAPQILLHPYDVWNVTGQDVIFGCEVFAYPMASIEWRKDGLDIQLPGDDPHISVQFRGGPQRFEVTGWLQIQAVRPSDEGTYRCLARNALGQVEAPASLTVLTPDQLNSTGIPQLLSLHLAPEEEAESEEGEDYY
ncbi:hypothetical protein E5288_WYG004347 [Bos mutus]|uniref:Kazal-type serine protease inhibitor domain-containing protein 1 n=1 Tax=Bos mutus TaxID=72004 RepID=A0A6B0RRH5_9CETA|nr:hypothetical protein [Bos mutus]